MEIVVCMKAVPSTTEVRMDPKTNTIIRDGKQSVVNPFDAAALECALAIKDRLDPPEAVHVKTLSMGIPDTARLLRDAIARGANSATLLSDRAFAGADTLATSYALSLALDLDGKSPDLVLCGKMAVDGDTAQIGPELAGLMNCPCITSVTEIIEATPDYVVVKHDTDNGSETLRTELPAVLTVTKDIAELRMPSIAGVRAAQNAEVVVLNADQAHADKTRCGLDGSPTQVVRSFVPERSNVAVEIAGAPTEQAERLIAIFEEAAK